MPKQEYVFHCADCDMYAIAHAIEPFTPPTEVLCPHCEQPMQRHYTPIPAQYHGEGWTGARHSHHHPSSTPTLDERAKMRGATDLEHEDKEPLSPYLPEDD